MNEAVKCFRDWLKRCGIYLRALAKWLILSAVVGVLCGVIARMGLVVSMRLHALIFACGQKTRTVAISYDPKVSGFMDYMGSENCVELPQVTEAALREMIDRAMAADPGTEQLSRLKTLAAENGRLAGKLLRGESIE